MRRVYGMKVTRITLGDLSTCFVLPASRGVGMGWQKSAEAIRVGLTSRQRAEHEEEVRSLEFR
jgi:RNA-directed DNA polymerase